jgi:hypothetical protein
VYAQWSGLHVYLWAMHAYVVKTSRVRGDITMQITSKISPVVYESTRWRKSDCGLVFLLIKLKTGTTYESPGLSIFCDIYSIIEKHSLPQEWDQ